jgi:hypothetical protein
MVVEVVQVLGGNPVLLKLSATCIVDLVLCQVADIPVDLSIRSGAPPNRKFPVRTGNVNLSGAPAFRTR